MRSENTLTGRLVRTEENSAPMSVVHVHPMGATCQTWDGHVWGLAVFPLESLIVCDAKGLRQAEMNGPM
jgi:hypothetical protein